MVTGTHNNGVACSSDGSWSTKRGRRLMETNAFSSSLADVLTLFCFDALAHS